MSNVYYVGSEPLSFEGIERILTQNMKLELSPEVKERIQRCRDYLDHKIEQQEGPLYGITTGFGSLCNKNISPDELSTLQENLVKSHACSVGDEVSPVIVRLMMLLKAHALSLGHSGVQVITVQRILDFFNNDVLPIVYDRGSLPRRRRRHREAGAGPVHHDPGGHRRPQPGGPAAPADAEVRGPVYVLLRRQAPQRLAGEGAH